ncbi:Ribose import permease protein RbsC [subsurface metagenome]
MAEIVERTKSATAKGIAQRIFRHENAALVAVLIALIAGMAALTKGHTATRTNVVNILLESSTRGVASVGQAFVILSAGIDVSVGGIGLIASVLGASIMTESAQWSLIGYSLPVYVVIPVMLLVASGFGALNGALVSRIGVPPLIATLGMWEICKGVAFQISEGVSIARLPDGMAFFGDGRIAGMLVPIIIFIVVAVVAYFVLNHTTFGKSLYAAGGNPTSAWLSGVSIRNMRLAVYTIAGFLAGLAGVIWTARTMSATMRSLTNLELDTIASVTIGGVSLAGGRGTLVGVVIGVIMIGVINNGMSLMGAGPFLQNVVKGAIIIAAVAIDYMRRR